MPENFGCAHCGKVYRWKPELAGKRIRCKCGEVIAAPDAQPSANGSPPSTSDRSATSGMPPVPSAAVSPPSESDRPAAAGASAVLSATVSPPALGRVEPTDEGDHDDALYDLADAPAPTRATPQRSSPVIGGAATAEPSRNSTCPSCRSPMPESAVLCTECGYNRKTRQRVMVPTAASGAIGASAAVAVPAAAIPSAMAGYAATVRRHGGADNEVEPPAWKELLVPSILVAIGVALQVFNATYGSDGFISLGLALPFLGLKLVINLLFAFAGVAIIVKYMEVALGSVGPAIIKLVAVALVPEGVATLVGTFVGSDSAWVRMMVSSMLFMPIGWFLFAWLFDLDFLEALYFEVIVWLLQQWVGIFILHAIFSGGMGAGSMTGIRGGGGSQAVSTEDGQAREVLKFNRVTDAKPWVIEGPNRMVQRLGHDKTVALVSGLLEAGAKEVKVLPGTAEYKGQAVAMVVLLPRDAASRKKVFDFHNDWTDENGGEDKTDEGQKYLVLKWGMF